jgi:Protein of unknown function (DUF3433)
MRGTSQLTSVSASSAIGHSSDSVETCPPGETCTPAPTSSPPSKAKRLAQVVTTVAPSSTSSPAAPTWSSINNVGDPSAPTAPPPGIFSNFGAWSSDDYFVGAYLPTMIAVLCSIMWEIIYLRLREMEAFFQLASPNGVHARSSLCLDYASSTLPKVVLKSIMSSHWIVLSAAAVSVIISASVALASEILYIGTTGICTSTGDGNDCHPFLALRPALARGMSGLVLTIFFSAIFILVQSRKRRSGLYAEATSIAGLATLLQDPAMKEGLRRIPRIPHELSNSEVEKLLVSRYRLGPSCQNEVTTDYGFISVGGDAVMYRANGRSDGCAPVQPSDGLNTQSTSRKRHVPKNGRPLWLRIPALAAFWLILAGLLIVIVYYRLVGNMSGFETFMDSQGMGVRFLMTAIGILIKSNWLLIERSILLSPLPFLPGS